MSYLKKKHIARAWTLLGCILPLMVSSCEYITPVEDEAEEVKVISVALDGTEVELTEGEMITLTVTLKPDDATDKTVTWTSSDESVVTVSAGGTVTAIAAGTAVITATAGDQSASCAVTVVKAAVAVESVSIDRASVTLNEGETVRLTAVVQPDNATNKTVAWTSSAPSITEVSADGTVKALKAGEAVITAEAGGKKADCRVTVSGTADTGDPAKIPDNEIWYTSTDGEPVVPADPSVFGVQIVSNTYTVVTKAADNGRGILRFDGPVTRIGSRAFQHCASLTGITLPGTVASVGSQAFQACPNLEAFYGALTSEDNRCLIVGDTLRAFAPADVTSYEIPSSVTSIGESVFSGCTGLESITLPESISSIESQAFEGCTGLTEVYIFSSTPPESDSGLFSDSPSVTIYVPAEAVESYETAAGWSGYTFQPAWEAPSLEDTEFKEWE